MYKSILVAVDLAHEGKGQALLDMAQKLVEPGGRLVLVHVIASIPASVEAELPAGLHESALAAALEDLKSLAATARAETRVLVKSGHTPSELLAAASEHGCDLIMVASHRPGLQDYFLGSTAARVVRHAPCSVLVMR
jgi:universal stress protein F